MTSKVYCSIEGRSSLFCPPLNQPAVLNDSLYLSANHEDAHSPWVLKAERLVESAAAKSSWMFTKSQLSLFSNLFMLLYIL